jgi:hypothetical protein
MNTEIKTRVEKIKLFVKKHQTLVACSTAAAVTAYIVRDKDITRLKAIVAQQALKEDQKFALLLDVTSFIDHKGLTEEFYDFAPRFIRD